MLAKVNRLQSAAEFRSVLRRGKRQNLHNIAVNTMTTSPNDPARFGFVVTRKVGNAVARNLVRRRLKAAARELVTQGLTGVDVVIRPFPIAAEATWGALRSDVQSAVKGPSRDV